MPTAPGGYQQPWQQPQGPTGPPMPQINATLSDFNSEPASAAGKSWVFHQRPVGTSYVGIVARETGDADVRPMTNQGQIVMRQDGSGQPKLILVVPMLVMPDAAYPDGRATMWVKGTLRDQLNAAMARVGVTRPNGTPESGALVQVTLANIRPTGNGRNPAYEYSVTYWPPSDPTTQQFSEALRSATPVASPAQQAQQAWAPQPSAPAEQYVAYGQYQQTPAAVAPPQQVDPQFAAYQQYMAAQAQAQQMQQPQAQPAPAQQMPAPQQMAQPQVQQPAPQQMAQPAQQMQQPQAQPAQVQQQPAPQQMAQPAAAGAPANNLAALTANMAPGQRELFERLAAQQAAGANA
jgi:hypothetical protein